ADAPVVHHVVEAVVRVHGGADGADFFAGCVFALLAAQRLKLQLRVFDIAGEVAVKAKPVHFTTAQDLLLAHGGNVVFGLTGDHARVATRAAVQVDDHAPLHALGEVVRAAHGLVPQAFLGRMLVPGVLGCEVFGAFEILFQISRAHDGTPHQGPVVLRAGERVQAVDLFDPDVLREVGGSGRGEDEGVEAGLFADAADLHAAVSEVQQGALVGHAGEDPRGDIQRLVAHGHAHHRTLAVVGQGRAGAFRIQQVLGDPQLFPDRGPDEQRVVPGELADRIGEFLKPGVVGEAA